MSSLSDDDSDSVCSEDSVFGADDNEKKKKRSKSKMINEGKISFFFHPEVNVLSFMTY